jgi:cyanate lyase
MTKDDMTLACLQAKKEKGLTYKDIEDAVGYDKVFLSSVIHGQNSVDVETATKLVAVLGLSDEFISAMTEYPLKGCLEDSVPVDPLIYRFHEITHVYGTSMKSVIHEMFGDGIMSAIDFKLDIAKEEDPKGDRVVITYNGKFLPYKKW